MNLDVDTWKEFRLGDLFSKMYKAEAHVKGDLECYNIPLENAVRFVSRTEMNNGCDCYVVNSGDITGIEDGNAITIGDTTATCFYQSDKFICGDHMVVCRADWLNLHTALFILSILKQEKYKYSYGRAFKMDLISSSIIKLPATAENEPNWGFMERYIKSLNHKPLATANGGGYESPTLGIDSWKPFKVRDLFQVKYGINMELNTCIEVDDDEDAVNFVARTEINNGVSAKVKRVDGKEPQEAGLITCAGGGSVLSTFLQEEPFYSGRDLYILTPLYEMSKLAKLFCITVIKANRYRYSYGRQANVTLPYLELLLPADNHGRPDFAFMEKYMKSLPYGDRI